MNVLPSKERIIEEMPVPEATSDVQALLGFIRQFIQHPRRFDPLLKNVPNWNVLASAMDVVSDTEWAITSYEKEDFLDKGLIYLVLYGLLQAMYAQQEALQNLVRALKTEPEYNITGEPEVELIRRVRNQTVGHPTMRPGSKIRKDGNPGEQTSHGIVQYSLRKEGFTTITASSLNETRFDHYMTEDLIARNRAVAVRVLTRTKAHLEQIEMDHRSQFRQEKLVSAFPNQMDYYFEKIHEAIHASSARETPIGNVALNEITNAANKLESALELRGLLNDLGGCRYAIEETQYPLDELHNYFLG